MACSVLVVDDDSAFRGLASRLLRTWEFAVVGEAGSVTAALALAVDLRPAAVLADIALPDGDGFQLARRLVAMPWLPRVVLISSDSDPANVGAARRAGARGFFPKGELSDPAVRELLEGR